ncbi:MAG TPA: cytochrome-c peroxidase [Planctomycetota bacterium]|nr:cytochrome-c peroxidase [Planctomycetota bacterium]
MVRTVRSFLLVLAAAAPALGGARAQEESRREPRDLPAFLGPLRPVRDPEDNPRTPAKVELGRMLYWDPRLSGNGVISCATCHNPALGWADGLPKGLGFHHKGLGRATPTVLNAAYYTSQFWDGRAATLEEQAKGPIMSPDEMNASPERMLQVLNSIPGYRKRFQEVFGGPATLDTVARAIAAFERTVVDLDSPFDRYARGDDSAIGEAAKRGLEIFTGKGRCATCHSGPNFSDNRFHNLGLGDGDPGRMKVTGREEDYGAFKTPTLRNIALTAPYMHDGSMRTLREVIDHYEKAPALNPKPRNLSIFMQPIKLTDSEKEDLIAFLRTLTGDKRPPGIDAVPELPQ